jgi:hypothetical protein
MRKIGTIFGITAFAAISFSATPIAAFGVRIGFSRPCNSAARSTNLRKQLKMLPSSYSCTIASGAGRYGDTRLRAVADAIKSIRPALENFYASLNDEQKAKFNMMGGPLPQRG